MMSNNGGAHTIKQVKVTSEECSQELFLYHGI